MKDKCSKCGINLISIEYISPLLSDEDFCNPLIKRHPLCKKCWEKECNNLYENVIYKEAHNG